MVYIDSLSAIAHLDLLVKVTIDYTLSPENYGGTSIDNSFN